MKKAVSMFAGVLLAIVLTAPLPAPGEASAADTQSVVTGNNAFATGLYRELGATEGNQFFSPYSISSAMGMTYAGARGNTAHEIKETLQFQLDQTGLNAAFKKQNRDLTATANASGQKLNIANALVLTGSDVSGEYKATLKNSYDAEIFAGGLDTINGWVKKKTEGKIEEILKELSADSVCVILNAIYFKGVWESQFQKNATREAPFSVSPAKKVTVPLMYQKGDFNFLEEKDFQAVSIPYKGKSLSMVILLPRVADGLPALERQLNPQTLKGWLAKLDPQRPREIELFLPKFKVESGYDLVPPFRKMGMTDAFSMSKADFTGMGWQKGKLFIGQIKHKAVVEVNEEGTEAAAATAVEMVTKSMPYYPVFRADHPFLYLIRDNRSGVILFMGRLADPTGR